MTQHLPIADAEELARWFLPKMDAGLRGRLMAERPQLYGRVFPGVRAHIITERVQRALEARPAPCPVQAGCYLEWPHYGPHTPDDTITAEEYESWPGNRNLDASPQTRPGHVIDPDWI